MQQVYNARISPPAVRRSRYTTGHWVFVCLCLGVLLYATGAGEGAGEGAMKLRPAACTLCKAAMLAQLVAAGARRVARMKLALL